MTPWIENFVDNVALVQFDHRLTAYLVLALALLHAFDARRTAPGGPARRATGIAGLVLAQGVLGITTLLLQVPLWAALAHQVFAMAVLTMAVVHARLSRGTVATTPNIVGPPVTPFGFEHLAGRAA